MTVFFVWYADFIYWFGLWFIWIRSWLGFSVALCVAGMLEADRGVWFGLWFTLE
jgi:hypothetical protein